MALTIEEELEQTKREVEILREEHKSFLYKVSHDLNAPIRHIDGFSNLILASNFEEFDDDTKKYFEIIMKSNTQLGGMLDSLLQLSRLSTRQKPFQAVDANVLIKLAISGSLADKVKGTSATIIVDKIPKLFGDPDQIAILFEELLKNSLSFVSPDTVPNIHISGEETDTHILCKVKDNGIGVGLKFREKIFELFKRDVDKEVYPGQGVGLTIAAKILERHNGKIWIEDNVPNGSVFHVTLPKAAAN